MREPPSVPMRAQRFPLQLAVEYRPVGRGGWRRASTANISSSGVLVREANPPTIDTQIEFRVVLAGGGAAPAGEVTGHGRVVRLALPPEAPEGGFAVTIDRYDIRSRLTAN